MKSNKFYNFIIMVCMTIIMSLGFASCSNSSNDEDNPVENVLAGTKWKTKNEIEWTEFNFISSSLVKYSIVWSDNGGGRHEYGPYTYKWDGKKGSFVHHWPASSDGRDPAKTEEIDFELYREVLKVTSYLYPDSKPDYSRPEEYTMIKY